MAVFNFPYERADLSSEFPVLVSASEDGTEQRRLVTNKNAREWRITSPNMTKAQAKALNDFFVAQRGSLESFTFADPISGTPLNCRFASNIRFEYSRSIVKATYTIVYDPIQEDV